MLDALDPGLLEKYFAHLTEFLNGLKGKQNGMLLEEAGGLVFIYGKREKNWSYGDCPIELN